MAKRNWRHANAGSVESNRKGSTLQKLHSTSGAKKEQGEAHLKQPLAVIMDNGSAASDGRSLHDFFAPL